MAENISRPENITDGQWKQATELYNTAKTRGDRYPELTVAQAALETGWFKSPAGRYNYFGQKASSGQVGSSKSTTEVSGGETYSTQAKFRDYSNLGEAVDDRLQKWGKKYQGANTVDEAIGSIWRYNPNTKTGEGYATDTQYGPKLKTILGSMGVSTSDTGNTTIARTDQGIDYQNLTPEQQAYFDAYVSQYNNIKGAEKSKEDAEADKAKASIAQKQQEQAFMEEMEQRTKQAPQREEQQQAPQFDGSAYRLEQQQMPTIQYAQLPETAFQDGGKKELNLAVRDNIPTFTNKKIIPNQKPIKDNYQDDIMDFIGVNKFRDAVDNTAIKRGVEGEHNGGLDALRHASSSAKVASILPMGPGFIAANVMGALHEVSPDSVWKETKSDLYNNFIGSAVGSIPFINDKQRQELLLEAQKRGVLSDLSKQKVAVEIEGRRYNPNKKQRAKIGYFAEGGMQTTDEYGDYDSEQQIDPPKKNNLVKEVTIQNPDGTTRKLKTDSKEYSELYKSGNLQTGEASKNDNRETWFGGGLDQINIVNNFKKKPISNTPQTAGSGKFPSLESQGIFKKDVNQNVQDKLRGEINQSLAVRETIPTLNNTKVESQIIKLTPKAKDTLGGKSPEQVLAEIQEKEKSKTKDKQDFKFDINNITEDDYNNLPQEQKDVINTQLKKNNLITPLSPGSTKEQIKDTQKLLVEKGYDLGTYGADKNGIDGIYGRKTTKALSDYNKKVDSEQAYSLIKKYNQENFLSKAPDNPNFFYINSDEGIKDVQTNYQKMGYLNPEIKNFDLNFDEKNLKTSPRTFSNSFIKPYSKDVCEYGKECATFVTNDVLTSMKSTFGGGAEQKFNESNVRGDAWTMDKNITDAGGKTMYSVFGEKKPNLQRNTGAIKGYIQERLANRPKVDISKLKEGDVVSMYYDKSPNFVKAYEESSRTFTTHIGILKKDKNNNLYVEHNVHGKIFRNPISDALKGTSAGNSKIQISAITRPTYNLDTSNSTVDTNSTSSNQAVNYDKVKNPNSPFIKGNLPVFQEAITRNKKVILKDVPINEREFNNLEKAATSIAWKESYGNQNVDSPGLSSVQGVKKLLGAVGDNLGVKELSRGFTQLKDEKNLNSNLRNRIIQNDKDLSDPKKSAIASFYSLASKYLYLRDLSKKNSIKMSDSDLTKLSMLSWNEDIKVVGDSVIKYRNYDDVMNAYRTDKKTNTVVGHPYDKAITFFENNFKIE